MRRPDVPWETVVLRRDLVRVAAGRPIAALAAALVAVVMAGCSDGSNRGGEAPAHASATVARVNDGDTLTLTSGAKVRLLQIDAPELATDCYGRRALEVLSGLAPAGRQVQLVQDSGLDDRDRYGRLLRYVFVGDTDVNVALVRRGAASPYFFRGERGRHAGELLDAVDAARAERRGYWGACPRATLNTAFGALTGPA